MSGIQRQSSRPIVLLLGNYRPTLAIARALAPLGYSIVVSGGGGEGAAEFSRHVAREAFPPDAGLNSTSQLDLSGIADAGVDIVVPVTEAFCRQVAANSSVLDQRVVWVTPSSEAVLACFDKPAMFARCRSLGIPVESWAATTRRDLRKTIDEVGLPCVVRPMDSTRRIGDEKAVFLEYHADIECSALTAMSQAERLIVQKTATGVRHNLYFAASRGVLVGFCEARIARTDRLDGSGLAVEGVTVDPSPNLVRWTESLTRSLNYNGIGCAQFIVDPGSGQSMFLEINPRVAGNHAIAEAAGLPLAELGIDLAMALTAPASPIIGRPGVRFAWTYGDLRGLREAFRSGGVTFAATLTWLGRAARAAVAADVHMTWSWSDPLPTFALSARQLRAAALAPFSRDTLALRRKEPRP